MHKAGRPSWQISVSDPQHLAIGLYVREAAMLSSHRGWLPAASPAVAGAENGFSQSAAPQWQAWWDRALDDDNDSPARAGQLSSSWWNPPDFEELLETPELRALVAAHFFAAVQWSQDRRTEHVDTMVNGQRGLFGTYLVADLERAEGRPARPFQLRITEIPVAGHELWQLRPDHVLVSAGLLRDTADYRRRLTPVVQALL